MILFVAAESREFNGIRRHLSDTRQPDWPVQFVLEGRLGRRQVGLVAHGPGPHLAGHAVNIARNRTTVEAMVSIGFCGALDPALQPGDIFMAAEVVDIEGNVVAQGCIPVTQRPNMLGRLLSTDRVASTAAEKRDLRRTGAAVIEMEAAAVAAAARAGGVPFYCVRVVTDTATEGFSIDFNRVRDDAGRFSRSRIIKEASRSPLKLFPELMRLDKRCRDAALTLGDFIADCQF